MLIKCVFPDDMIQKPIIYELGVKFDVVTNIEKANITSSLGWVTFWITGEEQEVRNSMDWLKKNGVEIEVLEKEA